MNFYGQETEASERPVQRLTDFQQKKVLQFLQLVKWVVKRIVDRLPKHIDGEDLMHSGILGLIDAVQRFAWEKENADSEFKPYAECRIRGQVMDELRRLDLLPRSTREKVTQYKREIDNQRRKLMREPSDQEVADGLKIDLEACFRLKAEANGGRQFSLDDAASGLDMMEGILRKTLNLINPNTPEGALHVKEVRKLIADEIDRLSDRERQVISLYYLEEMTLKEIGQVISITESRVSQIHAQALARLLQRLKLQFGAETFLSEEQL